MIKNFLTALMACLVVSTAHNAFAQYTPTQEVVDNQKDFANDQIGRAHV